MRYIKSQKTNSLKSFVYTMLNRILESIDNKLEDLKELSIKEGNQNWKKSKLAIILLTMKKIIIEILDLRKDKSNTPEKKKKIKTLLLKLKITAKLANNEMQKQKELDKEKELAKKKQKILTPFELVMLNQMQNVR
ncbi:MAG: hypothetical protein IJ638_00185 [Alphaproteobacteria bacterium]|nr:hypothetical protein [Alphaproteobacteria bacterium]